MAPPPRAGGTPGITRRGPRPGARRTGLGRRVSRNAAVLRDCRAFGAGAQHGAGPRPAPAGTAVHADVAFSPRRPSLPQELPRGDAAAARGVPLPEPAPIGFRRGVSHGLFVAPELRAPLEGGAGCDRWRVSTPLSL